MKILGATHLNILYFIYGTISRGSISNRIASLLFWLLLPIAYATMIYSLYSLFAPLKGVMAIVFLLVLSINRILAICIIEIIIRQQKIYYYVPADSLIKSILIDSILLGAFDFMIISAISAWHHTGIGADLTILIGQKILLFAVTGISYSVIKLILAFMNRRGANASQRSKLYFGDDLKTTTTFEVWKAKWLGANFIIPAFFILMGGVFAAIYFQTAQLIIIASATILLTIQANIYNGNISKLVETFALKATPYKLLLRDYSRLILWQIGLAFIAIIILATEGNLQFFMMAIAAIIISGYLLFAWCLYCNRFGAQLASGAIMGEIFVLLIIATTLLPLLPLFMALFLFINYKKQPKGFYAAS